MRVVEPDLPRRARRGMPNPVPGVRSSATGVLLTAALLVGGAASVYGVAAPAAAACDVGASQARLAEARHLVTALRVGESSDPRRAALARDLRALGVTPAVTTGWRQQAVDVSDQLRDTDDPTLRRIAVTLARAGVGPTPADLAEGEPPGPLEDLGDPAGRGRDVLGGVVDAAEQAVSALPPPRSPADAAAPTGGGRAPSPSTESSTASPQACTQTGDTRAENEKADEDGAAEPSAADDPSASGSPSPSTTRTPRTTAPAPASESGSAAATPVSSAGNAPEGSRTSSPQVPVPGSPELPAGPSSPDAPDTLPATPSTSASPGETGDGRPGDLRRAADAAQAVADLLRTLSEQSTPDADRLNDQLTQQLPGGDPAGSPPETSTEPDRTSQNPTSQPAPGTTSESTSQPATSRPATSQPSTSARPSGSVDPSVANDPGSPAPQKVGDWESQAGDLADQAQQAAGNDPLARELASKLQSAGFGGDESSNESGDDDSEAGAGSTPEPNSTTPQTSTPRTSTSQPSATETSAPAASATGTSRPETSEPGASDQASSTPARDASGSSTAEPVEPDGGSAGSGGGQEANAATWDRLADCESSGDWSADTGNGYAGGLQFDPATWEAFGGTGSAEQAPRAEQIAVAQRVQAEQGWAAWPACSQKLGLL